MTTTALNNLWAYLQTLSLTKKNREWLADRLVEKTEKKVFAEGREEIKEIENGQRTSEVVDIKNASSCNMTVNSLVEEQLLAAMERKEFKRTPACGLSDEELEAELAGFPSLDDTGLKELTNEDFHQLAKQMSHKPIKGIEKWL